MKSQKSQPRLLVTGGAGFIGSHLADELIQHGRITIVDNLSSGRWEFIQHLTNNAECEFIEADLLDIERVISITEGYELIFHLAANPDVRSGVTDTGTHIQNGTLATYNILEAMRINNIKKLFYTSSSAIYGETDGRPIPENYSPTIPISMYGASKLAGEILITTFSHLFGIQAWIVRLANVVGPRLNHGVIYDFVNKLKCNPTRLEILGDGLQKKNYLYVPDCIRAMLFVLTHAKDQVNIFNVASHSVTSVQDIASMVVSILGLNNVDFYYTGGDRGWLGDVPSCKLSTEKMDGLGWEAIFNSNEAVRHAIEDMYRGF